MRVFPTAAHDAPAGEIADVRKPSPAAAEAPEVIGKTTGGRSREDIREVACACGCSWADEDAFCRKCGKQRGPQGVSGELRQDMETMAPQLPHPELVRAYVEDGRARTDRLRMILYTTIFLALCAAFAVLFFKYMPDFLKLLEVIADELEDHKNDAGILMLCQIVCILYSATPLPGRGAWNLVVGFIYGWWGAIFLVAGHSCGSQIAFSASRYLWDRCCPAGQQGAQHLPRCCTICLPRKFILLIWASLGAIEGKPLKMLFLLCFSPAPSTILAYIIGAKCPTVRWWQYWVPATASGVKLLSPIYLATKADDISKLLQGGASDDPVDVVLTVGSVLVAIGSAVLIGQYSLRMLRASQEELAREAAATISVEEPTGDHADTQPSQPDLQREPSSSSMSELSRVLVIEYAESEEGQKKAQSLGLPNAVPLKT